MFSLKVAILAVLIPIALCKLTRFYSEPGNRYYYSYHPYTRGARSIQNVETRESTVTFQGGNDQKLFLQFNNYNI